MEKQCKKEQTFSGGGTDHPVFREKEWYRENIIVMIQQINNEKFLNQIHTILRRHIEKRGG